MEPFFSAAPLCAPAASERCQPYGGVVLDEELRLGRPRFGRLSFEQQAEAVELLARLLADAAGSHDRRRTLRRSPPPSSRRAPGRVARPPR